MGLLQVLLISYAHLRCVAASLPASPVFHPAVARPSPILRPTQSAATAAAAAAAATTAVRLPSSFPHTNRASAYVTGRRCAHACYSQRKRRRRQRRRQMEAAGELHEEYRRGLVGNTCAGVWGWASVSGLRTREAESMCLSPPSAVTHTRYAVTERFSRLVLNPPRCFTGGLLHSTCSEEVLRSTGSSAMQTSRRGCHRTSTARLDTPDTTSSSSDMHHAGSTEAAPSLLESILRRLDSNTAAEPTSTVGSEGTPSGPSSSHRLATAATTRGGSSTCETVDRRRVAYVPLLFRSDFIESALQRRQRSAMQPVMSTTVAPSALSANVKPAQSRVTEAVVGQPCGWPPLVPYQLPSTTKRGVSTVRSDDIGRERVAPQSSHDSAQASLPVTATSAVAHQQRRSAFSLHGGVEKSVAMGSDDDPFAPLVDSYPRKGEKAARAAATQEALAELRDNDDEAVADHDGGSDSRDPGVPQTVSAAAAASAAPLQQRRRSRTLILDPVEWLAQSADAPLMDAEMLYSNTAVTDQLSDAVKATEASGDSGEYHDGNGTETTSALEGDAAPTREQSPPTHTTSTLEVALGAEEQQGHTRDGEEREAALLADLMSDIPRRRRSKKKNSGPLQHALPETSSSTPAESSEPPPSSSPHPSAGTSPRAVEPDALVYNVFTRRVAKASSSSIRMLALLGIGVHPDTRELTLTDSDVLQDLADELRARRVSWPKLWSRGPLYRQLERILSDERVADPAERVAGLLRLQYSKSHLARQRPGLVVGDGSPSGSTDASSLDPAALPASVAETIDDKLLTLQDLNAEQQAVVELVMKGYHTYIGGGAGTGKSVLLRVMKQRLVREGLAVAVTGTTGIAGTQIGGSTLHHCLGINMNGEFTRRKELSSYDAIIIDEVSMLSRELFESLEVHLRRANNIHLPFGGVQIILCGDFLQLGAIGSRPLITSPLFRRHFVQLKLRTVVRQNADMRFAAQLHQLRRGQVPVDLPDTVRFMTPQQIQAEHDAEVDLKTRQQEQLACLAPQTTGEDDGVEIVEEAAATDAAAATSNEYSNPNGPSDTPTSVIPFVHGAVNLLPTNKEVNSTNAQQLQRLPGELVRYVPQFLPPCLVGSWSPTYILRVREPAKLKVTVLRLEVQHYLRNFYTLKQRASQLSKPTAATTAAAAAGAFSDGEWLLNEHLGERSVVLYDLFVDAFAFRVRLPLTLDREEARQFLLHVAELDKHLAKLDLGVRVRDVLIHGEGLHTEQDEYVLSQYAARAPLAHSLDLKIGARVMLRANFAPGLVNGSLGTVVSFRKLVLEELPRYLVGNAQREEAIMHYSDFLQYEQGFQVAMVPVVDFNGRQVPIPPITQYVGGMHNTHYYSMGVVALPLSLAYAFTVHKVQGLTLVGRVHLELSRMWPCEHLLYVAMSRVRNPDQLSVSSFHPRLVRAAADCLLFDDSLPPVWEAKIPPYMLAATWRRSPNRRKKVLLRKKLEAYAKQRKTKLMDDARKGDIRAEIELLEEAMLKRRAQAAAKRQKNV